MRCDRIAYAQKPLISDHSDISRGERDLKFVLRPLLLSYLVLPGVCAGSSEPSPLVDAIRTNISCADKFIDNISLSLNNSLLTMLIYFQNQYDHLNSLHFEHHLSAYIQVLYYPH